MKKQYLLPVASVVALVLLTCNLPSQFQPTDSNPVLLVTLLQGDISAVPLDSAVQQRLTDTCAVNDPLTFAGVVIPAGITAKRVSWDFKDGTTCDSAIAHHRFSSSGTYHPVFTFVDVHGDSLTNDSIAVTVDAPPDSVVLLSPADGAVNIRAGSMLGWMGYDRDAYDERLRYDVRVVEHSGTVDTLVADDTARSAQLPATLPRSERLTWSVTARDRYGYSATSKTFSFTMAPLSTAALSDLRVSSGTLTPAFDSSLAEYVDTLAYGDSSVTVTAQTVDVLATIGIAGAPATADSVSSKVTLPVGPSSIAILSTAADSGSTKSATIHFVRLPNTDARLASLTLSAGALVPAFDSSVTEYVDTVPTATASLSIILRAVDAGATVNIGADTLRPGASLKPIALSVGQNDISVIVTAMDRTTRRVYTLRVERLDIPTTDAARCTLSVRAEPLNGGSVTGDVAQRDYAFGSVVNLTAAPEAGFSFSNWKGSASGNTNPLPVVMTGNKVITAVFAQVVCSLTVSDDGNGTTVPTGTSAVLYGAATKISASATHGFLFVRWITVSGNPMVVDPTAASTSVACTASAHIRATFSNNTAVLRVLSDGHGSTIPTDSANAIRGTPVEIAAQPSRGYHFVKWTVVSGQATIGDTTSSITTATISAAASIKAGFAIDSYPVNLTISGNGSVTRDPDEPLYQYGDSVKLTATPDQYRSFVGWTGDTACTSSVLNLVVDTVKNLTVTFGLETFALGVSSVNGTIDVFPQKTTYASGDSVHLTATADACYVFINWTGSVSSATNPLNITMDSDKTLAANFKCADGAVPKISVEPRDVSVCPGAAARFSVAASSCATPTYRWYKGGSAISGATDSSYAIQQVTASDTGSYTCHIANACGRDTSAAATLSLFTPLTVTLHPDSMPRCVNQPATFSVDASGTPPMSFQWRKDGSDLAGKTGSSLVIAGASVDDSGRYACVVTNSCGTSTSNAGQLTVIVPPKISLQPLSLTKCVGEAATLTVNARGTTPLSYQWQKDGSNIRDAIDPSYTLASTTTAAAGSYRCIVGNCSGADTSAVATLSVGAPPLVVDQTGSVTKCMNQPVAFFVTASGAQPFTYQWRKNGVSLQGARDSAYAIAGVTAGDAAQYSCIITNCSGKDTSAEATLSVNSSAAITTQPSGLIKCVGESAVFSISATGSSPLSYQWRKGDLDIAGATDREFSIPAIDTSYAGSYKCLVSNACGPQLSDAGVLSIRQFTLAVSHSPDVGGTTNPPASSNVFCNLPQSIFANISTGYHFLNWTVVAGSAVVGNASASSTSVTLNSNASIAANFAIDTCAITVTQGANGLISPGTTVVNYGGSQTFTIAPADCYRIADVSVDGVSQGAITSYAFTNVTGAHSITATYAINSYSITVTQGANGSISPSTTSVNCGSSQTFTITPAACYRIASVSVDGVSQGAIASYTFSNVTSAHSITATYAINSYSITVTQGANGSISPGTTSVNCGGSQTFTIAPAACYRIASVSVDGVSQGAVTSYIFTNVTAPHTIAAGFDIKTYTLTASAGASGSITPAGVTTVSCGANQTYTITPAPGCHISDVNVNGISQGAISSYTFTNIGTDCSISASFAKNQYTLTINGQTGPGVDCALYFDNNLVASGTAITVNHGESHSISTCEEFQPNSAPSVCFKNWIQSAGTGTATFGNANAASTTVTLINGDANIGGMYRGCY